MGKMAVQQMAMATRPVKRPAQTESKVAGGWMAEVGTFLALLLACGFALLRAWQADQRIGAFTQCNGCYLLPTLARDALLLALIASLLALGALVRPGWIRRMLRLATIPLLIGMAADVAVWSLLSQRFYLSDLIGVFGAMGASWTVLVGDLSTTAGLLRWTIGLAVPVAVAGLLRLPPRRPRLALGLLIVAAGWAALALVQRQPLAYVHQDMIRSVIEINLAQGRQTAYGSAFGSAAVARVATLPRTCEQQSGRSPNLIIVMAESLSAWQSGLLGGPADWTPELDALARSHHYFTRFYANGFTTSGGETAVITGVPPLYRPGAPFANYVLPSGNADGLPALAHRHGYKAQYFANGDNDFLDVGHWLRALGFDHVEGKESPFYASLPRFAFDAPEDKALFDRYLAWLDQRQPGDPPFLSQLTTMTGHPPFHDPGSGHYDQERTVRYVDAQIARFQRQLQARGFFDDGILLILGDHRSMTPLRVEELQAHGERAFARIPLLVIGDVDMPARVDGAFQQSDLLPSLAGLLGEKVCRTMFQGSFLQPDPQPARYVIHARGDDRNRIDVYSEPDALAAYRLDGDNSRWMSVPPADADDVAAWITALRAGEPTGMPD